MNFSKLIIHQARIHEHEPAIAFVGGIATYGMLARAVASAGEHMDRAGLRRGTVVAIETRNPFHHICLMLALELRGIASAAVQTGTNLRLTGLDVSAILRDGPIEADADVPVVPVDPGWFSVDPRAPAPFAQLMALPGFDSPNETTRVVFSSGTTGVPKATALTTALLSERVFHNIAVIGSGMKRLGTMMGASTLPGYMLPIALLSSGGMYCLADNPVDLLHLVRSLRLDTLVASVMQLDGVLKALGNAQPPALNTVIAMGSRMPAPLLAQVQSRLCANVLFVYGATETGAISYAPGNMLGGQEGAAGYLLPWVTLEVVDENDTPLPRGSEGIFRIRSPELALHLGAAATESYRDGWYYPGDVGIRRPDDSIEVTGRVGEVINRGGSIVAPDVVEQVLKSRPEIVEAAVFAVRRADGMDEICAAIEVRQPVDIKELLRFCRDRLADKAPGVIRVVDALPRTETGKIRRQQAREDFVAATQSR